MLEAVTAFSGGLLLKQHLNAVQLPKLSRSRHGAPSFKLSARILAASVPGLATPGLLSQQRPFLEATLGSATKETEFADFAGNLSGGAAGAYAKECPWRFSDTITFRATLEDVLGPGLRLRLRVRKDIMLGPLQFEMRAVDVGEGTVDLRRLVLPGCVQEKRPAGGAGGTWTSPTMLVPLAHIKGGVCGTEGKLGEAVAHVAVLFSMDADPEEVLAAAGVGRKALKQKLDDSIQEMEQRIESCGDGLIQRFDEPGPLARACDRIGAILPQEIAWIPDFYVPVDGKAAQARAQLRAWSISSMDDFLSAPEAEPDEWVSKLGPDQRKFWHHRSLGPAPWEAGDVVPRVEAPEKVAPLLAPSPDEASEGWISHRRADGQTLWHHRGLGPVPWEPADVAEEGSAGGREPDVAEEGSAAQVTLSRGLQAQVVERRQGFDDVMQISL